MPSLAAIGLVSRDVPASIRFYRLLGVAFPEPKGDGDHVEATLPSGIRLMLDSVELIMKLDPAWSEPTGHRMGLAFECASVAEVDEVHRKMVDAGYASKTRPHDAFWGQRYAQVVDPDGNVVDLFAGM